MHTIIIAEAGVNHNGDIHIAKKMVDAAAEAGADYVKFQTFKASKLVSTIASKAEYQKNNAKGVVESQFNMLRMLELSEADHRALISHCSIKNIKFLSAPFDLESIDFLYSLGLRLFKIPSGEITNLPYLERISQVADSVVMSTGMSTLSEVSDAMEVLRSGSDIDISILHCNTEYPTPFKDVNLRAMDQIRQQFNVKVGYSDHTLGIEVPIAAVALGAHIIEKHFTLNRNMTGPDHIASLEPDEFKKMVSAIRNVEKSLGISDKLPSESEMKNISIARKSIHLAVDKFEGQLITEQDIVMLRPGDGISPMKLRKVVGKKMLGNFKSGHKLSFEDIED